MPGTFSATLKLKSGNADVTGSFQKVGDSKLPNKAIRPTDNEQSQLAGSIKKKQSKVEVNNVSLHVPIYLHNARANSMQGY